MNDYERFEELLASLSGIYDETKRKQEETEELINLQEKGSLYRGGSAYKNWARAVNDLQENLQQNINRFRERLAHFEEANFQGLNEELMPSIGDINSTDARTAEIVAEMEALLSRLEGHQ